jgi:hypothetical protein
MPNSLMLGNTLAGLIFFPIYILMAWEMAGHEGRPSLTLMSSDNVDTEERGGLCVIVYVCVCVWRDLYGE